MAIVYPEKISICDAANENTTPIQVNKVAALHSFETINNKNYDETIKR